MYNIYIHINIYSGTPLLRPPLFHQKSVLSSWVVFCQSWKSVNFSLVKWRIQLGWPLVRLASQKGFHCMYINTYYNYYICTVLTELTVAHSLTALSKSSSSTLSSSLCRISDRASSLSSWKWLFFKTFYKEKYMFNLTY